MWCGNVVRELCVLFVFVALCFRGQLVLIFCIGVVRCVCLVILGLSFICPFDFNVIFSVCNA